MSKPNLKITSNTGIEIRHFHCPACQAKLFELVDWESEECAYCGQEFHGEMSADYEPDRYVLMVDPNTGVPFIQDQSPSIEKELSAKKVRYEGDVGHFDGLTYGLVYEVIGENETQYVVFPNDLGAKSTIQKSKFYIFEQRTG